MATPRTEGRYATLNAIKRWSDGEALHRRGLTTVDAIWREVGKDANLGVDQLVQSDGLDRACLIRDLLDSAGLDASEGEPSRLRLRPFDLLISAAALLLLVLVAWSVPRARSVGLALRDLRRGDRVSAEALHGAEPGQLADRRLTRSVAAGKYVDAAWLAPVPALDELRLRGRLHLLLAIRREDRRLLPPLPGLATLGVSASEAKPPQALLLRDVPVLSAEPSGDTVTVEAAFTESELQSLLPLLPQAEVRVLR